jgi:hypothetical protein
MKTSPTLMVMLVLVLGGLFGQTGKLSGAEPETGAPTAPVGTTSITTQPTPVAPSATPPSAQNTLSAASGIASQKVEPEKTSPIRFAKGPADGSQQAIALLMRSAKTFKIPIDSSVTVETRPPLARYAMQRTDDLGTLTPRGYFYFLENAGKIVAFAQYENATQRVSHVGAASANILQQAKIIAQLPTLDQVKTGSYEARFLRVSLGMQYFDVIWLKSDPGGTDLIYQLAPSISAMTLPYGLQAGTIYKLDDFLKLIRTPTTN